MNCCQFKANPSDFAPWNACCYNPETEVCIPQIGWTSKTPAGCVNRTLLTTTTTTTVALSTCGPDKLTCGGLAHCCTSMPSPAFDPALQKCTTIPCANLCAGSNDDRTCEAGKNCCQFKASPSGFAPWKSCCYDPAVEVCVPQVGFGVKSVAGCVKKAVAPYKTNVYLPPNDSDGREKQLVV